MRRAVITGVGPVTPIGIGKEAFFNGLQVGKSAVRKITAFDTSEYRSRIAAEIVDFDPTSFFDSRQLRRLERFAQLALSATRLAVQDAELDLEGVDKDRLGVCIGSALGGIGLAEEQCRVYNEQGLKGVEPSLALSVFCGSGSCNVAIETGASGPVTTNSNSCASSTIALGEALGFIRRDEADVVLAGGAEAPLSPLCFGAFAIIRAMSTRNDDPEHASRPFDAARDGFVMGEGAAVLVVEELGHAVRRGARIYGEVAGYSLSNDAYHMTAPRPDGSQAAKTMAGAIADAGLTPNEIEYINAHGSSTPLNDRTETTAIKNVFGEWAYKVPISSTKGHHAHALGATGAMEAAACALALERGYIPPTVNLEQPEPECDLDYVPREGRDQQVRTIISNSFGFGGINACVVLRKLE